MRRRRFPVCWLAVLALTAVAEERAEAFTSSCRSACPPCVLTGCHIVERPLPAEGATVSVSGSGVSVSRLANDSAGRLTFTITVSSGAAAGVYSAIYRHPAEGTIVGDSFFQVSSCTPTPVPRTPTSIPTATPAGSQLRTPTPFPPVAPTASPTGTPTPTPTQPGSQVHTPTPTSTGSQVRTPSPPPPASTSTPTPTPTSTSIGSQVRTPLPTSPPPRWITPTFGDPPPFPQPPAPPWGPTRERDTRTPTPTQTPRFTRTPSPTRTPSATPTETPTPTPTRTRPPSPTPGVCKASATLRPGPAIRVTKRYPEREKSKTRTNEGFAFHAEGTDLDALLQVCVCSSPGGESVWRELPDAVSVEWSAPGAGGSFASSGPAAFWTAPDLRVGESRSSRVRARLLSASADDPAALVDFVVNVTRTKECEYEREVTSQVRESPAESLRIPTGSDQCRPAELAWKPAPQPITNESSGTVFACTGQLVFLAGKGRDADTLEVPCEGPCGSDRAMRERPGDLRWLWSTAAQGTFVGFGPTATTSGAETGVVYRAPDRPATEVLQVLAFNAPGDPAFDPPVARSIIVRTFLTDLVLGGRAGTDAGGCPTGFVCLNDDDDDGDGREDRAQPGVVRGERDLLKVTLVREPKEGSVVFDVPRGAAKVKVWLDPEKQRAALLPLTVPAAQTPKDLYVEGVATSGARGDVELLLRSESSPRCEVRRSLTVVRTVLAFGALAPLLNEKPGGVLCLNDDDDDRNGRPDLDDSPSSFDDLDVVPLVLDREPRDRPVTLRLGTDATRIRVWRDRRKANLVAGDTVFQAAELPVTLWVEGTAPSDAKRDSGLALEDPESGCVEPLRLTVWDLELKLHEPVGGTHTVLTERDEEDPGGVLGVNVDDDDGNGVPDLRQHPVTGENDLLKLTAEVKPKDTEATLRFGEGLGRLHVWSSPVKGAEINPADGIAIRGTDGPREFWLEGVRGSAKKGDVAMTLSSTEAGCEEKVRVTSLDLQLRADLDFNGRHEPADDALARPRGLWLTTNEDDDDRDGVQDLTDGSVAVAAAVPPSRDESTLKRVLVVGTLPQGLSEGKVVLRRSDARTRVYRDRRKGVAAPNDAALLFEGAGAFAAAIEGNGRKSWDLAVPAERTQLVAILADGLWVEGSAASAAERDTSLTLSYERAGKDAVALSELPVTVVRFERLTVTVDPTPEIPARVPANAPARQTFENRRNDVVGYLDVDPRSPDRYFEDLRFFVLVRKSDPEVDLSLVRQGPGAVRWGLVRMQDDHASLGTALPALTEGPAPGAAVLSTDENGSFAVQAWVDVSGDGRYTDGEPRIVAPFVLASARFLADASEAHPHVHALAFAGGARADSAAPGKNGFQLAFPGDAAVYLWGMAEILGGGSEARRGVEKVFGGWVQNITEFTGLFGTYDAGHSVTYIFAFPPLPAGKNFVVDGPAAAPNVIATPIIDGNVGSAGGSTALIAPRHFRRSNAGPIGQRIIARAVDSPGIPFLTVHPRFPASTLRTFSFGIGFQDFFAVWTQFDGVDPAAWNPKAPTATPPGPYATSFADSHYTVLAHFTWRTTGEWTVPPGGGAPIVSTAPDCTRTAIVIPKEPVSAESLSVSTRAPEAIRNVARDARN